MYFHVNAWSGLLVTSKTYVQTHFRTVLVTSTTTISGNHVGRTTVQFFLSPTLLPGKLNSIDATLPCC